MYNLFDFRLLRPRRRIGNGADDQKNSNESTKQSGYGEKTFLHNGDFPGKVNRRLGMVKIYRVGLNLVK